MRTPSLGTHAAQLDRWLGANETEHLSAMMKDWYGPPIAVAGVPGRVFAHRGGDFRGSIHTGKFASCYDVAERFYNATQKRIRAIARGAQMNAGFATFAELIAAQSAGQIVNFDFQKAGATGVAAVTNSLFGLGAQPAAGAASGAAPGGTALTDATTGCPTYTNPTSGTLHITGGFGNASVANTLLVYDRLFGVAKTMNSTATEAVTGVPTRYQSTTGGAADSAEGNFLFVEVGGTALAATAHNWTVCQYTDQGGTTAVNLPSLTGNSGAIVRRLDHPVGQWYAPLATGDTGIKALTQMQCSAAVATGLIDFVIGHPLAWLPCPVVNIMIPYDGTAAGLVRIFDDAALALLEITKPATTATNYNARIKAVWN